MTDEGARLWHVQRKAELSGMIARAKSVDALDRLYRATQHELDTDHERQIQQRMTALKAMGQR